MAEMCPRCHESDRIEQTEYGPWCRRCLSYTAAGPLDRRQALAAGVRWIPPPEFEGPPLAHGGAAVAETPCDRVLGPEGSPESRQAAREASAELAQRQASLAGGETATCRSCGAPIRWVRTRAGKAMPLDAEPVATGNVVLGEDGVARVLTRKQVEGGGIVGDRYVSHHATCPQASQHRRGRS